MALVAHKCRAARSIQRDTIKPKPCPEGHCGPLLECASAVKGAQRTSNVGSADCDTLQGVEDSRFCMFAAFFPAS